MRLTVDECAAEVAGEVSPDAAHAAAKRQIAVSTGTVMRAARMPPVLVFTAPHTPTRSIVLAHFIVPGSPVGFLMGVCEIV